MILAAGPPRPCRRPPCLNANLVIDAGESVQRAESLLLAVAFHPRRRDRPPARVADILPVYLRMHEAFAFAALLPVDGPPPRWKGVTWHWRPPECRSPPAQPPRSSTPANPSTAPRTTRDRRRRP